MQFFNQFDGYNIIFLAWVLLVLLSLFEINFKGIRSFNYAEESRNLLELNAQAIAARMSDENHISSEEGNNVP